MGERLNDSGLTRVLQKIKTLFVLNSKDSDGMVLKGSGQANKVWKTNAQGEPAWRDEETGTVTVTDNNPTLAWNTKSKVGTINGTDLNVTMPANPDTWRPVVDGLTSSDADKSLSANQGRMLKSMLDTLITAQGNKMNGILVSGANDGRVVIAFKYSQLPVITSVLQVVFASNYIRVDMTDGTTKQVALT